MSQSIFNDLYKILVDISANCESAIKPLQCVLEATGSKYHFRVPNSSKKQIIGWGNLRLSHSTKFGKNEPCVIIGVDAVLLNDKSPDYQAHYYKNAKFRNDDDAIGLVQVPVCQIGGNDYKLALQTLIEASLNLVSGKRYIW